MLATFLLLPFEGARLVFWGVPVYLIEIATLSCGIILAAILYSQHLRNDRTAFSALLPPQHLTTGILILFGSIIFSALAAHSKNAICPLSSETLIAALGILKSWFLFPILFGYILFFISQRYFSRDNLLFIFAISFLPFCIYSSLMWIFGSHTTYDGRFESTFNSPNALAMFLTPVFLLSWYFFRIKRTAFWFSFSSLIFFLLFLTHSFSAWLAICIALLFFESARRHFTPKTLGMMLGTAILSLAVFFFAYGNTPRFEHFFSLDSRSSFASRVMIWKSAGKMLADSPLFGIGPGNFQNCYLSYQRFFPPYLEWSAPEPHNIFLAFWLGGGIVGLIAFCFLVLAWLRHILRARTKTENPLVLWIFIALMIAFLTHGLFDTPYWRLSLAYLFWIIFFLGLSPERPSSKHPTN